MPPGAGPDRLVDVGPVWVDAAGALGDAGQGVLQGGAAPAVPVWLRGVRGSNCGRAGGVAGEDGGHADEQGDQGEEGPHDDELLRSGKLGKMIKKKLSANELWESILCERHFESIRSFLCVPVFSTELTILMAFLFLYSSHERWQLDENVDLLKKILDL